MRSNRLSVGLAIALLYGLMVSQRVGCTPVKKDALKMDPTEAVDVHIPEESGGLSTPQISEYSRLQSHMPSAFGTMQQKMPTILRTSTKDLQEEEPSMPSLLEAILQRFKRSPGYPCGGWGKPLPIPPPCHS